MGPKRTVETLYTQLAMPFPNFIVIGAARSGTTSLHHYLGQHPQVFMCPVKEPNYFAFDGTFDELRGPGIGYLIENSIVDRDAYLNLFGQARGAAAIGEVSPRYMIAEGCAGRIYKTIPEARLIAILRHPVERAWASFVGHRKNGWEKCENFRDAFAAEPARKAAGQSMGLHFSAGLYASRLEPYFDLFGPERIRVVLYDDLVSDPAGLLGDLFGFLQVDANFRADMSFQHNPSGMIRNSGMRWFWGRSEDLRRKVRGVMPKPFRDWAYTQISRNQVRTELPASFRAEFTEYFHADILRLSSMIGRNLDHWLIQA
jgi:hypothetical protein